MTLVLRLSVEVLRVQKNFRVVLGRWEWRPPVLLQSLLIWPVVPPLNEELTCPAETTNLGFADYESTIMLIRPMQPPFRTPVDEVLFAFPL